MSARQPTSTNPFYASSNQPHAQDDTADEWEEWSDDPASPSHPDRLLIDFSDEPASKSFGRQSSVRNPQHRPVQLPRVKSRARQKAQNAKAGIKLVTDMSQFRQAALVAQQRSADARQKGKFADAAALHALEGNPTTPSIGSFAWLKRQKGNAQNKKAMRSGAGDLSPEARPIVIGISVPSDDAGSHQVSPQTAVIETPMDLQPFTRKAAGKKGLALTPQQQRSVWSPDTEASESPYNGGRPASSMYTQQIGYGSPNTAMTAPPVPMLPATLKFKQTAAVQGQEEDDTGTPCTLFEEDGSPVAHRKSQKVKATTTSPESASSRSHGWWDHVMTPFTPQSNNPFKTKPQETGSSSATTHQDWWTGRDEKAGASAGASHLPNAKAPAQQAEDDIISNVIERREQTHAEKSRILMEENHPDDAPPPYELQKEAKAAFVQSSAGSQRVPSPGPMTPGLPGTMTSQGGIGLADIPLTPTPRSLPSTVLPNRPAGSYRTGDHFRNAPGRANETERQRRRYEKEDVIARKAGGFWRGRGLIPEEGCFGRTGREGRKRRRVCLGIMGGVLAAIILIVVLAVVLTRHAMSTTGAKSSSGDHTSQYQVPAYWLNLTEFPPIPTGVLTVSGPKNLVAESACFTDETPETAWTCALPKEAQDPKAPYEPNQPEFIFQIQFDNSTQALWKLYDTADDNDHYITDSSFQPDPSPPSLKEVRFLGNTTDHIAADRKEGEPTPFFISLLNSTDEIVGENVLTRRQSGNPIGNAGGNGTGSVNPTDSLPDPDLNADGTGAPARLFPLPVQQPVRLFDRGLSSEHYGFYSYFDKKIYMANDTHLDPADRNGGVPIEDATSLVTFTQIRFLVQIWTRLENTTHLLGDATVNVTASPFIQPGSMPYPVTITEDMHGGIGSQKTDFAFAVRKNQEIDRSAARFVTVDLGFNGTLINPYQTEDTSLGGIDGGTGGCKCQWVNYENS
ncbi:hypothetical protein GGR57DRAFT_490554 [Xylariaceae sp. FL1272]|nr:hypothetical protein GGR57DRAFT_490554 [Xylariaceae sp. FL1272]